MQKFKAILRDKRVVAGAVVAVAILFGATIDPATLDQIVTFIASLAN